jgi:RNA-directed DNA polymerase
MGRRRLAGIKSTAPPWGEGVKAGTVPGHELSVYVAHVTYTRYADDLTFSAKRTGYLNQVEKILRRTIKGIKSPSLTLNESKTVLATKKYKCFVTGLTLTNDGNVSLGRESKRKIRAALKHYADHKLDIQSVATLNWSIAFVSDRNS